MKAKLIILVAVLFFSISLFSQQEDGTIVYNNFDNTNSGSTKEYITVDQRTSTPLKKVTHLFDTAGNKLARTLYAWTDEGWIGTQKTEFVYNKDNQVAAILYTKWDSKRYAWSDKSEYVIYAYNDRHEWVAESRIEVNSNGTDMAGISTSR
ncbi:DUF3836 domain-containing protein [Dysgonomonas sp. ZJ709]|uniref:DUF3836 domain-containing protein n=1 Tax=Dysgonomonas sp. ZJ709 TaxID=2709797 RepID=UPI0013E9AFCC|nr:DUF3836 domain-containing protein [Dysgonomonas sp. ZJ709]